MAYMSQEHKTRIAAQLKRVIPQSWKWSLAVRHHSTIVLTIQSAPYDLLAEWTENVNANRNRRGDAPMARPDHADVNHYHLQNQFGESLALFQEIKHAMDLDNHDRSDIMTDYHDVGHYIDINIGRWDKPFVVTQSARQAA